MKARSSNSFVLLPFLLALMGMNSVRATPLPSVLDAASLRYDFSVNNSSSTRASSFSCAATVRTGNETAVHASLEFFDDVMIPHLKTQLATYEFIAVYSRGNQADVAIFEVSRSDENTVFSARPEDFKIQTTLQLREVPGENKKRGSLTAWDQNTFLDLTCEVI